MDYKKVKDELVLWIKDWFERNGSGCNAILGLSGGKDSTIVATLCKEALGADRVIGVAMPDAGQGDNGAKDICDFLGIRYINAPIDSVTNAFKCIWHVFGDEDFKWSKQSEQNIPPRVRMTMLYALAQTYNGRVVGTCNASENYVGYFTRYGDGAADFEPLGNLVVEDVRGIGYALGLPREWVDKVPDDGLPNSAPDDEKFAKWGFSYALLDKYIKTGTSGDAEADAAIKAKHEATEFKMKMPEMFLPSE